MSAITPEFTELLDRVRTWSPEMRIVLARKVLETLEPPAVSQPPRTMPLKDVIGLLKTDAPPPDDAQCEEIIEQERTRKFG